MTKIIDSTNLGYLISKIKAAFWPKTDVVQIGLDDTPTANSNNLVKSGGVKSALDTKQNTLVSGTSIKTINNESLLGSGNISISGGSGGEANVIEAITFNGTPATITNKTAAITATIPAAVTESTVSGWGFAKTASPALTGTPTAPTAAASTNNTQIATTAFVKTAINNLDLSDYVDYDTYNEDQETIAGALTDLNTNKQATLVSGTNIKTINNESLLGSGNISIAGTGSGEANVIESITFNGNSVPVSNKNASIMVSIPIASVDSTSTSTAFTATVSGITALEDGVCCYLKNTIVASAAGCTLNINNLGAKPIYVTTAAATAATTQFAKNYTFLFIYNASRISGGCWDIWQLYNTNTTYSAMTTSAIQAGTATTARTITAAVLAENYNITDGTINIAGNSITIKTARIEVNDLSSWTSVTGYSTLYTTIVSSLKTSLNDLWRLAVTEDQDPYWPTTYYYLSYFGEEDGFIEFIGSDNITITLWNNGNIIKSVASSITPGTLITNATTAQTASSGEAMSGNITLHKISKTGNFSDLLGTELVMTADNSHVLRAVNGDGITGIIGESDSLIYALGDNNADGTENYVLATTNKIKFKVLNVSAQLDSSTTSWQDNPLSILNNLWSAIITEINDKSVPVLHFVDRVGNLNDLWLYFAYDHREISNTIGFQDLETGYILDIPEPSQSGGDTSGTWNKLIPTKVSDLTNDSGFTSNTGTITGITMNGSSKGTSGVVNLGTVITSETALSKGTTTGTGNAVTDISVSGHQITLTKGTTFLTSHQDISGKASLSGAAFTGAVTGTSSGNAAQFRNITISSSEPTSSSGSNGDIWIVI